MLQTVLSWLLDLAQWGFSILELPISTKTPSKSHPKKKRNYRKLYHTTYFLETTIQKRPVTNQKLGTPWNLSGSFRMAWRLKPRRSGSDVSPLLESIPRSTSMIFRWFFGKKNIQGPKHMWKAVPSDRQPIPPGPRLSPPSRNGHIQRQNQKQCIFCKHWNMTSKNSQLFPQALMNDFFFFCEVSTFGSTIYDSYDSYITWCPRATHSAPHQAAHLDQPHECLQRSIPWNGGMLTLPDWCLQCFTMLH